MIKTLIARYRQNSFIESHRFLLLYANIIAVIHGIGFILQGTMRSDNLIKYALTDVNAWHGGLPALSIFNVSLLSGAFTIIFAFITVYLIIQKLHSKWHWLLTITLFFSGGGICVFFHCKYNACFSLLKRNKTAQQILCFRRSTFNPPIFMDGGKLDSRMDISGLNVKYWFSFVFHI